MILWVTSCGVASSFFPPCKYKYDISEQAIADFGESMKNKLTLMGPVFENRIVRRIFGPKWDENGEWRRLHNEELHNLYRSPNIVRVIKSRRLRWVGHVSRMEVLSKF